MYEDKIKDSDISDKVLCPELIVSEACRSCVGQHRGGQNCKNGSAECPKVADIEKILVLIDDHKAAENDEPAANGYGKISLRALFKLGDTDQTPIISHFGYYHRKAYGVSPSVLVFASGKLVAEKIDREYYGDSRQNSQQMRKGKNFKFDFGSFTEKIMKKFLHNKTIRLCDKSIIS
jgi:hypothetical protein